MREILFRGKRSDTGQWVEGSLLIDGVTGQYFIHSNDDTVNESDKVGEEGCLRFFAFEVDPETVGQYTGLTDRNGVKIFEGDIIKFKQYKSGYIVKPVEYDHEWNRFCVFINGAESMGVNKHLSDDIVIIGNIYDNPELLEEWKK